MGLKIYNTLTGEKEDFVPLKENSVSIYVCGPTVYDYSHIGHARSVVVFDTVVRYFRACGYKVKYIRNFTDVDDKIIKRANEKGVSSEEIALKFIDEFSKDMAALNALKPDHEPKATEHIDEIVQLIKTLVEKGYAYEVDGDVYFRVEKLNEYGKLSGRNIEDMRAGARIEVDERKESPFDFALWKSAKPGEPYWETPFGKGRPGWHIECSAMSRKYLGETFDIHGGGKDLIFPHHENEIAQSEAAHDKEFVRYWMHNGFVRIDHEKMSKSLNNFLTIKDTLELWHPEVVRFFLLSKHYRSPIDFTENSLKEAESSLDRIYTFLEKAESFTDSYENESFSDLPVWNEFVSAMDDDFNTARAIGIIFESVRTANKNIDEKKNIREIALTAAAVKKMGTCLGVLFLSPDEYFRKKPAKNQIDEEFIENLIKERTLARKNKDFKRADEIRKELLEKGVILEDRPDGTFWKFG
ncbi:MAG: cysteine--tRNA ligase [Deltaproteobacteria bacterium]|nr:MAG: cysteine--tRNA ligase [Deltaproteobacteria bacterium]